MNNNPVAWIVYDCPDFYFMPTMYFDQIFLHWDNNSWKSPKYWDDLGFDTDPLFKCEEEVANYWIVNNDYGVFDKESADSARSLGKLVQPVRVNSNE